MARDLALPRRPLAPVRVPLLRRGAVAVLCHQCQGARARGRGLEGTRRRSDPLFQHRLDGLVQLLVTARWQHQSADPPLTTLTVRQHCVPLCTAGRGRDAHMVLVPTPGPTTNTRLVGEL